MAYSFDGTDDWIRFGAGAFSGDAMRPGTYAILAKPTGRANAWRGFLCVRTSAGAVRWDGIELSNVNDWAFWNGQVGGDQIDGEVDANITTPGDFVLVVLTWDGSNDVRFHWQLGEAGAWNHASIADTTGASTTFNATDEWIVGTDPTLADDFQGDVTIWGAKSGEALNDAAVESTFATAFDGPAAWDAYFTGANTVCNGFDGTGSRTDRTGNGGDETARSSGLGASIASDPAGWSWGGGGTAHALSATIAGVSTMSADLALQARLAATIAAVSTTAAALRSDKPLSATVNAVSTVSAALRLDASLAAQIDAVSTMAAALQLNEEEIAVLVTRMMMGYGI